MTKRTLRKGQAVVRLNETVYMGTVARALINQGPNRIQAIKLIIEVDSVGMVDAAVQSVLAWFGGSE